MQWINIEKEMTSYDCSGPMKLRRCQPGHAIASISFFSVAVVKYPGKNNGKGDGFILASSFREIEFIMAEKT